MTREVTTNSAQPLLSGVQRVSFGEFGRTDLSTNRFVFTPEFAKSVYEALYDNSFGRTSATPADRVGENLAFFPGVCVSLRTQMEALRFGANAETIKAFLADLLRMNQLIQNQHKKNAESQDNSVRLFAKTFQEQVNRIFSYIAMLYSELGEFIQRIDVSNETAQSKEEVVVPAQQRERTVYCVSRLRSPDKLFMPDIALDIYKQLIDFSRARNLTHLFNESDAMAIRDMIENASSVDHYISIIVKLTRFQSKSSDSDYSKLLKAIAEQIGAYISITRLDIVESLNQRFNVVKSDLDAKNAQACSQCGKAMGCCCLALLAHPAYSYFAFFSPVFVAGGSWNVVPITFAAMGELLALFGCFGYTLPKTLEYCGLFCHSRNEANQLSSNLSNIASAKAVAAPVPREMC